MSEGIIMKKVRTIIGLGINDVDYCVHKTAIIDGKKKIVQTCPYYADWKQMLQRCYDLKFQERNPTYKSCTVCEDWLSLSSFIEWVDSQPNKDWQNCQLDKDFLLEGNKHYSPESCVYLTRTLNMFLNTRAKKRGACMLGVRVDKNSGVNPYMAQCRNPFTDKGEYLGLFPTELEAHLAWKARKHEHACVYADMQQDDRVAKRLREMYSPDRDLTIK
jgi:hypothetical protein